MRWPLVFRSEHERLMLEGRRLASLCEERAAARLAVLERTHLEVVGILQEMLRAERARAVQTAGVTPAPVELAEQRPDPIKGVIREQAGEDHRLAAHLRSYSNKLKREGKSTDEIVGALVQWQTSESAET